MCLYHPGDTSLTIEFELIGRLNKIDLALLPIGDNFTMGPADALEAVKMLKPKTVVPMHYNTWELIAQDPDNFKAKVETEPRPKSGLSSRARQSIFEPLFSTGKRKDGGKNDI